MTSSDVVPDRGELQERARSAIRRRRLVVVGFAGAILLSGPLIGFLVATDGEFSGRTILIGFVPVVVGGLVVLALLPVIRRQDRDPSLLLGADRTTRRAVQEALRTGHAPDSRIDALAADTARRTLRFTWLLWVTAGAALLQVGLVVARLVDGDGWGGIALGAVTAAAFGASAVAQLIGRRRSSRYLTNEATEDNRS
jgi:hypothetical protein